MDEGKAFLGNRNLDANGLNKPICMFASVYARKKNVSHTTEPLTVVGGFEMKQNNDATTHNLL